MGMKRNKGILKLCAFMKYDEALKYYDLIKSDKNLQDKCFEIFFNYIEKNLDGIL